MPELSDALHELYDAEVRVPVHPSRGVNVLAGEARGVRRRRQARAMSAGAVAALAVGALVVGGVHVFGGITSPAATMPSTPSASPTAQTQAVTWNPVDEVTQVIAGFTVSECGDEFAPPESTVDNVRAGVEGAYGTITVSGSNLGDPIVLTPSFTSTDGESRDLLASAAGFVLTRDGEVVYTNISEGVIADNVDLYSTDIVSDSEQVAFPNHSCEAEAALAALYADMEWDPAAPHDQAEQNSAHGKAVTEARDKLIAKYQKWPSGDYEAYLIAPVLFGEQLAAAQQLKAAGVNHVAYVRSSIGDTPLASDTRLSAYCFDTGDGWNCNSVPQDVIDEVLTFDIDPADVDNTPSGVAISAPTTVKVP